MSGTDPRLSLEEDIVSDPFGVAVTRLPSDRTDLNSVKSDLSQQPVSLEINANEATVEGAIEDQQPPKVSKEDGSTSLATVSGHTTSDNAEEMTDYGQEVIQLPKTFVVKYLGQEDASGLWGIKYTRKPVDEMVGAAKNLKAPASLPVVKLEVSTDGIKMSNAGTPSGVKGKNPIVIQEEFPIDTVSYGVQDLVYTRVFAVIIVRESDNVVEKHPFRCHAFVCDSRGNARRLTLALAKAFQEFSKALKSADADPNRQTPSMRPKKLAIDLRSADEIKKDLIEEEDSEA